ncbi:MAG: HEPN domain-containing protein [Thermoflexales bacterium]|nr:HEPN domain-containing protein [Thermoflexales bacterium]
MKPITKEWMDKAEQDYQVVAFLQDAGLPVYDVICFHAQQSAEKFLKAWLIEQGVDFPRTHDLEILAKLALPSFPDLQSLLDDLRFLTSFAVEIRYPGFAAEKEDADRCRDIAERLRALVLQTLA